MEVTSSAEDCLDSTTILNSIDLTLAKDQGAQLSRLEGTLRLSNEMTALRHRSTHWRWSHQIHAQGRGSDTG